MESSRARDLISSQAIKISIFTRSPRTDSLNLRASQERAAILRHTWHCHGPCINRASIQSLSERERRLKSIRLSRQKSSIPPPCSEKWSPRISSRNFSRRLRRCELYSLYSDATWKSGSRDIEKEFPSTNRTQTVCHKQVGRLALFRGLSRKAHFNTRSKKLEHGIPTDFGPRYDQLR